MRRTERNGVQGRDTVLPERVVPMECLIREGAGNSPGPGRWTRVGWGESEEEHDLSCGCQVGGVGDSLSAPLNSPERVGALKPFQGHHRGCP